MIWCLSCNVGKHFLTTNLSPSVLRAVDPVFSQTLGKFLLVSFAIQAFEPDLTNTFGRRGKNRRKEAVAKEVEKEKREGKEEKEVEEEEEEKEEEEEEEVGEE